MLASYAIARSHGIMFNRGELSDSYDRKKSDGFAEMRSAKEKLQKQ